MPKSRKRKNRKSPYITQVILRKQKIHQPDGSVKEIVAEKIVIKHLRHQSGTEAIDPWKGMADKISKLGSNEK